MNQNQDSTNSAPIHQRLLRPFVIAYCLPWLFLIGYALIRIFNFRQHINDPRLPELSQSNIFLGFVSMTLYLLPLGLAGWFLANRFSRMTHRTWTTLLAKNLVYSVLLSVVFLGWIYTIVTILPHKKIPSMDLGIFGFYFLISSTIVFVVNATLLFLITKNLTQRA